MIYLPVVITNLPTLTFLDHPQHQPCSDKPQDALYQSNKERTYSSMTVSRRANLTG